MWSAKEGEAVSEHYWVRIDFFCYDHSGQVMVRGLRNDDARFVVWDIIPLAERSRSYEELRMEWEPVLHVRLNEYLDAEYPESYRRQYQEGLKQ
jgi:hypothetical protein